MKKATEKKLKHARYMPGKRLRIHHDIHHEKRNLWIDNGLQAIPIDS